jgi:hypothetical protein
VTHNEHGPFLAVTTQTSDEIRALWIKRENLRLDAFLFQSSLCRVGR